MERGRVGVEIEAELSSRREEVGGQVEAEEEGTGVRAVDEHRWRRKRSNTMMRSEDDSWSAGVWAQLDAGL
jgi:hypothetical protein